MMEDSVVDIQVLEEKELAWRTSMTSRLPKLTGKECACLGYLMAMYPENKNSFKALIAAEYSAFNVAVAKDFQMGVSNETPEFLKMNPIGKIPVLETLEGSIFENNAIARCVAKLKAENPLYGSTVFEYAQIEQWIDFASNVIDANIAQWLYPRLGLGCEEMRGCEEWRNARICCWR